MKGSISNDDIDKLRDFVNSDEIHCLSNVKSVSGLNDWVDTTIDVRGKLSDNKFKISDISETLTDMAQLCPSLNLKIHVGYNETLKCVATIIAKDSEVILVDPEIESICKMTHDMMLHNMMTLGFGL